MRASANNAGEGKYPETPALLIAGGCAGVAGLIPLIRGFSAYLPLNCQVSWSSRTANVDQKMMLALECAGGNLDGSKRCR